MLFTVNGDILEKVEESRWDEAFADDRIKVGVLTPERFRGNCLKFGVQESEAAEYLDSVEIFQNAVEVYEHYTCGMFHFVNVALAGEEKYRIGFFFQKNFFTLIPFSENLAKLAQPNVEGVRKYVRKPITMEKMVCGILEGMLASATEELRFTEAMIPVLEKQLQTEQIDEDMHEEIYELRSRISSVKEFCEQMIDIGETLEDNDNKLLPEGELRYIKNFVHKVERLRERSDRLSDTLVYLRELMDIVLNNRLNNLMKVFTIISLIFQPITMIAGWYGMNFINMPELTWKYGYLFVIIINVLVIAGLWYGFKRKKML